MEWRTIETAPKDGTRVIVCFDFATVTVVHIAWYRGEDEWKRSGQYCGGWETLEDWIGWWTYPRNSISQEKLEGPSAPTYWTPFTDPFN